MTWPYRNPYPEGTFAHDVEAALRWLEDYGEAVIKNLGRVYSWLRGAR